MYLTPIVHDWQSSVHFARDNRQFCGLDVYLDIMVNCFGVMQDSHYNTLPKQSLQCCFAFDSAVHQSTMIVYLQLFKWEESMRATFSYGSILHAVGRVLDQVGVKSIAIHEEEDGLFVEGFNGEGQLQVQMRYDVASLYDLVSRSENQVEEYSERVTAENEGTLHRFLAEHKRELVSVYR